MDKIISYLVENLAISERRVREITSATISVLKQRLRLYEWVLINDQVLFFIEKKSERVLIDPIHYTKALIPPTLSIVLTKNIASLSDKSRNVIVRDLTTLVSIQADLDEVNSQIFIQKLMEAFDLVLKETGSVKVDGFGTFKRIKKRGENPNFHRKNAFRIRFQPETSFKKDVNRVFIFFDSSVLSIKELPNNASFSIQKIQSKAVETKESSSSLQVKEKPLSLDSELLEESNSSNLSTTSSDENISHSENSERTASEVKQEKKMADFVNRFLSTSSTNKGSFDIKKDENQRETSHISPKNKLSEQVIPSTIPEQKSSDFQDNNQGEIIVDNPIIEYKSDENKVITNHKLEAINTLQPEAKDSVHQFADEVNQQKKEDIIIFEKENIEVLNNEDEHKIIDDFSNSINILPSETKESASQFIDEVNQQKNDVIIFEKENIEVAADKNKQHEKKDSNNAINSILEAAANEFHEVATTASDEFSDNDDLSTLYMTEALSGKTITELEHVVDTDSSNNKEDVKSEDISINDDNTSFREKQAFDSSDYMRNKLDVSSAMSTEEKGEKAVLSQNEKIQKRTMTPFSQQQDVFLNSFDITQIMEGLPEFQNQDVREDVPATTNNSSVDTHDVVAFFGEDNPDDDINDHPSVNPSNENSMKKIDAKDDIITKGSDAEIAIKKENSHKSSMDKERDSDKQEKKPKSVRSTRYLFQYYFKILLASLAVLLVVGFIFFKVVKQEKNKPSVIEVNVVDESTIDDFVDELVPEDSPKPVQEESMLGTVSIQNGITLQSLAGRYYGNEVFWIYLYEVNKDKIPNVHQIKSGTRIVIPNPVVYKFDIVSESAIQLAKRKGDALLNETQAE